MESNNDTQPDYTEADIKAMIAKMGQSLIRCSTLLLHQQINSDVKHQNKTFQERDRQNTNDNVGANEGTPGDA